MCTTDYIQERAQELEASAQRKIEIIDFLVTGLLKAQTAANEAPRAAGLLATLLGMHAELLEQKAAALHVIEDAMALRSHTTDLKL